MDNVELVQPIGEFKWFFPAVDDERLQYFARRLMKEDRYLSDEYRNYDIIWGMIKQIFYGNGLNIVYEVGDFQGLLAFIDIIPKWKCSVIFKIWDRAIWNRTNVRDGIKVINRLFDALNLVRMETHTPDKRMAKMAQMVGFKEEGHRFKAFKWNGKIYDITLLSKIRED